MYSSFPHLLYSRPTDTKLIMLKKMLIYQQSFYILYIWPFYPLNQFYRIEVLSENINNLKINLRFKQGQVGYVFWENLPLEIMYP